MQAVVPVRNPPKKTWEFFVTKKKKRGTCIVYSRSIRVKVQRGPWEKRERGLDSFVGSSSRRIELIAWEEEHLICPWENRKGALNTHTHVQWENGSLATSWQGPSACDIFYISLELSNWLTVINSVPNELHVQNHAEKKNLATSIACKTWNMSVLKHHTTSAQPCV
jgi:hypothetical protein